MENKQDNAKQAIDRPHDETLIHRLILIYFEIPKVVSFRRRAQRGGGIIINTEKICRSYRLRLKIYVRR